MCGRDDADRAFGVVRRYGDVKGVGNGRDFANLGNPTGVHQVGLRHIDAV